MYRIATSTSPALVNPSDWSHSFNDFLGYALEIDVCGPRRRRVLRSTSAFLPPSCWTTLFVAWRAQRRSSASSLLWQSKSSRTTGSDCIHWISCGYHHCGSLCHCCCCLLLLFFNLKFYCSSTESVLYDWHCNNIECIFIVWWSTYMCFPV